MVYKLGQEVVLLDGTSLIGRITDGMLNDVDGELKPSYKVSLNGHEGRWYPGDEIAPYVPAADPLPQSDPGAEADWKRDNERGDLNVDTGRYLEPAPADAGADVTDFYSEFERGWDMATQSMIDIFERAIENPAGGDVQANLVSLVREFRKTYPKHGVRKAQQAPDAGEGG